MSSLCTCARRLARIIIIIGDAIVMNRRKRFRGRCEFRRSLGCFKQDSIRCHKGLGPSWQRMIFFRERLQVAAAGQTGVVAT